ncbi:MAG: ATP-dependent DNA helicase RecG [Candidatus Liptonbacteria bacterium]
MLELDTPLEALPSVGPKFWQKFKRLGLETVRDLLYSFPVRYEDFSEVFRIDDLEPGQQATVRGVVEEVNVRHTWKKNLTIVEAWISDDSGKIRAVWFNQPYIKNVLRPGKLANFSGKVSASEEDIYLSHPTYELLSFHETKHTARLVPIYPETKGLTSRGIRFVVQPVLANLAPQADWLPEEIRRARNYPTLGQALHKIHFPEHLEDAEQAKKRFIFEDLFLLQLLNLRQKLKLAQEKAPSIEISVPEIKKLLGYLPFELTPSQKRSFWEVAQDIARTRPMNRLLQGDVGSGKTAVAALAGMVAAHKGFQTAVMAPTEVLARQHFETFRKLLKRLPRDKQPSLALMTAHQNKILYENDLESEVKKKEMQQAVQRAKVKIIIGTHALIQKSVGFRKLGLVVIDEQHRFGVNQRAQLMQGSRTSTHRTSNVERPSLLPHFLSMSATPIPRTLMLTIFGDLDISTIDELPAGRKPILTKIVPPENRTKAYGFIKGQILKGRQVFVICPRIEPSPTDADGAQTDAESFPRSSAHTPHKSALLWEVKSVKEEYQKLKERIFPEFNVAMLHGQMKSAEKEQIMRSFREGKIDVLVSTSVIEVGVDVPNAAIMMIEGADRFGLAQLYQFRGRVGRGEHQSFCFLFTDSHSRSTLERLKAIVTAKNGFELAERDLELRGPGEFIGQKQTGLPDIAMRGLRDGDLIRESRQTAVGILKRDPSLTSHPLLKAKTNEFQAKIHLE